MGKSSINGLFFMAMLHNQMVHAISWLHVQNLLNLLLAQNLIMWFFRVSYLLIGWTSHPRSGLSIVVSTHSLFPNREVCDRKDGYDVWTNCWEVFNSGQRCLDSCRMTKHKNRGRLMENATWTQPLMVGKATSPAAKVGSVFKIWLVILGYMDWA